MHPSQFIPQEIFATIRKYSAESESLRQLHPEVLNSIYQQNWFNLFVPKKYRGLGLTLKGALQIQEALSCAEGSVGWTVTLCSGANYFIGYLDAQVSKQLFNDPKVCFAGSGHASGIAIPTEDGYIINGRWKYATGVPHATVVTAVCVVQDGDKNENRAFWFYPNEIIVHHDWNTMGMIATASHSFEVKDLKVPRNRTFIIEPDHAVLPDLIYQYPFLQFAEATLAINMAGMSMHFIDLAKEIFQQKNQYENKAIEAGHILNNARTSFYNAIDESWNQLIKNNFIPQDHLTSVSNTSRTLSSIARQQVNNLYPFCGLTAATPTSPINRVWRDLHTASQHPLVRT